MKIEFNEARAKILDIVDNMDADEAMKLLSIIIGVVMDEHETTKVSVEHKKSGLTVDVKLTKEEPEL